VSERPPDQKDAPAERPIGEGDGATPIQEEARPEPGEVPQGTDTEAPEAPEEAPSLPDVEQPSADAAEVEASPPEAEGPEEPAGPPVPGEPEPEEADDFVEAIEEPGEEEGEAAEPAMEESEPPAEEAPEGPEEAEPAAAPPAVEPAAAAGDPFAGSGDWYVIHTYAGYENKVKTNLESRINTMQMQDKIFEVVIPMEDVMEIKGGRKQVVQKKVFPGYLLVKMVYDDDSWYVVRNTPGVTGFVSSGTGQKPTPLSRREVEKILAVKKEEVKPTFRLDFEEGDVVRIISGPFADFNGTIDEINVDQSKVKVLVNIFDRETPVELSFDQVARV
jgi:transcriptional antiterminator NusG